jgi:kynureninase
MPSAFSATQGAQGYQQSNPSVLATASLLGSLQIFKEVGMMPALRARSIELTSFLETRLVQSTFYVPLSEVSSRYPPGAESVSMGPGFTIITPDNPDARGAQLSLLFLPAGSEMVRRVSRGLTSYGVIGDKREPDVIRLSPAPLYNSLGECERAARHLEDVLGAGVLGVKSD